MYKGPHIPSDVSSDFKRYWKQGENNWMNVFKIK